MKCLIFILIMFSSCEEQPSLPVKPVNYIQASQEFVESFIEKQDPINFVKLFENADLEQLKAQLATDKQKITFWVNIYNGYILYILQKNPGLYEDRRSFFKAKQIKIGKEMWSFADIEHGIIRGSQHEYFLGYMKKWFPSKREKKLRVKKRDYRIHFMLNCGAKSCPPVYPIDIENFDEILNSSTTSYLKTNSKYEDETQTVYTTTLFSWFRGDFGGKKGIKRILFEKGIIPDTKVKLQYTSYDWTLDLTNFRK